MNTRKPIIEILTDFDGTLTNKPGGSLVFTNFYKSLQMNPDAHYTSRLLSQNEILAQFEKYFTEKELKTHQRDPRRMSEAAVKFLKYVVNHDQIGVCIISKNQLDYIKAHLTFEGFTEQEIDRLQIYEMSSKLLESAHYLNTKSPQEVYVYDDSLEDGEKMRQSAKEKCDKVTLVHKEPGQFDWEAQLENLKKKFHDLPTLVLGSLFQSPVQQPVTSTLETEHLATLSQPSL